MATAVTGSYSWESKIKNLKTSDDEIIDIVKDVMSHGKEDERIAFQIAIQNRRSVTEFMSNVLAAISSTARGVIQNFRA